MLPSVTILGREFTLYGFLGLAGVIAAVLFAFFRAKKCDVPREDIVYMGMLSGIGIVVGGKIMYLLVDIPNIIEYRAYIFGSFDQLIAYLSGGFVFYGGLFGALFVIWLYCRFFKVDYEKVMICTIPSFPLMHAIGRVGCYCAGCCYGVNGMPVQLYECAGNLLILALLLLAEKLGKQRYMFHLYLTLYPLMRFVLEFYRADAERGIFFGMSTSQWVSIAVLLYVVIARLRVTAKKKTKEQE